MTKKRFIAGARCPDCGLEDKIYVLWTESGKSRHCADCGFEDRFEEPSTPKSGEWVPVKVPDS